ncbi:MAG TPA: hypothetical protein PK098_03670 [Phycisphaerales bacterium]|nr:hypothetical protein [Phycisphaerales bacterium]
MRNENFDQHAEPDERQRAAAARAEQRLANVQELIKELPESTWERPTPLWIRVAEGAVTVGCGVGIVWAFSQPWRWWWIGGIVLASALAAGLLYLLRPRSLGEQMAHEEITAAIDQLLIEATDWDKVDEDVESSKARG